LVYFIFRNLVKNYFFWKDDDSYEFTRKGVMIVKLEDGSKRYVENIYHILGLKKKLMLVSKITNVEYKLEFSFESCFKQCVWFLINFMSHSFLIPYIDFICYKDSIWHLRGSKNLGWKFCAFWNLTLKSAMAWLTSSA